jgi:prepilin-type N-terminal cleavage/methylation domain-containing protein
MRRRAFTLVEMMVSIAIFAIVALALQSAVLLASKAIPDGKSANVSQLAGSRAAERLTAELTFALSVTEMTATAVTFTVADRDNDGAPETIRYAWSGVAGDPLTRQYNAGTAAGVLDDVREFSLAYDKISTKNPTTYTESAETLLYSFTGGLLNSTFTVQPDDWCGQYFVPNLPNNITYWRVTRVRYQAQKHSSDDGLTRVQLRKATSGGLPTNTVLDQTTLVEASMNSNYAWIDSYFTGAARLDPSAGLCLVFRWMSNDESCDILSRTVTLALVGGSQFVSTSNSGVTWSGNVLRSMPLYVYGTCATQDADSYTYNLGSVRLQLRSDTNAAARVNSAVQLLSQPVVSGP